MNQSGSFFGMSKEFFLVLLIKVFVYFFNRVVNRTIKPPPFGEYVWNVLKAYHIKEI